MVGILGIIGRNPKHLITPVSNALPFLKPKGWPTLRKMSGVSRYGYSEDDDMIEHALDELLSAMDSKDSKKVMSALRALIDVIQNKEETHGDALPL